MGRAKGSFWQAGKYRYSHTYYERIFIIYLTLLIYHKIVVKLEFRFMNFYQNH